MYHTLYMDSLKIQVTSPFSFINELSKILQSTLFSLFSGKILTLALLPYLVTVQKVSKSNAVQLVPRWPPFNTQSVVAVTLFPFPFSFPVDSLTDDELKHDIVELENKVELLKKQLAAFEHMRELYEKGKSHSNPF